MSDEAPFLFRNFCLMTTAAAGDQPSGQVDLGLIPNGSLLMRGECIEWLGPTDELPASSRGCPYLDGRGRLLTPGLIDCHTHLVFAGDRVDDWRARSAGVSYAEIARRGGGISSTVRATRAASRQALTDMAIERLRAKAAEGVTTVEIKSGYGLDLQSEIKMLDVLQDLTRLTPLTISRTLLAAHAIPPEFAGRADDFIDYVVGTILPACADQIDAIDVFCESIAFDLAQSERVLRAGREFNKGLKIHAEQLTLTGGAQRAATLGAWSADHLEYLDKAGVQSMAESGTVATLLPGAYYFLKETQQPPVAWLREAQVPMAVATDFNPGSSPVSSLLLAANMGVTLFGLTPEEALLGVTRHAARALRLDDRIGSLEMGKQADLVVWECGSPYELIYPVGGYPAAQVYKAGQPMAAF